MKNVLWLFCFLVVTTAFAGDNKAFVYNEHGKRDPLAPLVSPSGTIISYDSDITATDMVLEGVVLDARGKNLAIINGKIVKPGDLVGSYTVESIANDRVDLAQGQERLIIKLKKGGI